MAALTLAIPSKGRLQEQVLQYFTDAGLKVSQSAGARDYRAAIDGMPDVEVKLLSAGEIATALRQGDIHLGVTGEDLIRDTEGGARNIALLQPMGFGFATVVVAVPRAWIDVASMADLDDVCTAFHVRHHRRLRVATKYLGLTRAFFAEHGIGDYRIVESLGATEGAPAAGTAEVIVDITTTGNTLAANDLKVLDDGAILKSQAQLAASTVAAWTDSARTAAAALTSRIAARELARNTHMLRARLNNKPNLAAFGGSIVAAPTSAAGEYTILCPRPQLMSALALLRPHASDAITVHDSEYAFAAANPIMERLTGALSASAR